MEDKIKTIEINGVEFSFNVNVKRQILANSNVKLFL